ncbi:hypothetical protein AK812_SmicGene19660 [Symbiodinium microadriaticum]|uniref:Uncharacterized protein n=1 Tax=Symbiodinium microadriaticum TaxID=2951 RepID=A0A1Q9DRZ2_SYMMI|nr:hypothetical protein AK812_SmicGene19660 [Symbiodinium microadriaticum]
MEQSKAERKAALLRELAELEKDETDSLQEAAQTEKKDEPNGLVQAALTNKAVEVVDLEFQQKVSLTPYCFMTWLSQRKPGSTSHDRDALLDLEDRLEAAIAVRQAEETASTLDKTGQAELAAMRQKKDSLTNNKRQRDKYQSRQPGAFGTSYSSRQLSLSPKPDQSLPVADPARPAGQNREPLN